MFPGSIYPTRRAISYDETGSGEAMMMASELEIVTYQLLHKILMEFIQLYLCFRGPDI